MSSFKSLIVRYPIETPNFNPSFIIVPLFELSARLETSDLLMFPNVCNLKSFEASFISIL